MSQQKYAPLTCYRIHYNNGTSRLTDMASGVTLQEATDYFLGQTFTEEDPETGKETRYTCIKVEAYTQAE